ncbi:hypothetical protein ACWDSD_23425 [Streptomyces spiralis]
MAFFSQILPAKRAGHWDKNSKSWTSNDTSSGHRRRHRKRHSDHSGHRHNK